MRRNGFTLMEVNLAVFIMAVGVLTMVSLYPLGFRESRQSREDVAGAAVADGVLGPLAAALSSTNMTWQAWRQICGGAGQSYPSEGWVSYCKGTQDYRPAQKATIRSTADGVISRICNAYKGDGDPKTSAMAALNAYRGSPAYAIVAYQSDAGTIRLSMRVATRAAMLFSQPLYYTEVHFQGMGE